MYRDNRLNAIHEGTHGIQALDLLGRKVTMKGGAALMLLSQRIQRTVGKASAAPALMAWGQALADKVAALGSVTAALFADGDVKAALANATLYLQALGHIVLAWTWLELALVATREGRAEEDEAFYRGELAACRYFFGYELPKVDAWLAVLTARDSTTLEMEDAWF